MNVNAAPRSPVSAGRHAQDAQRPGRSFILSPGSLRQYLRYATSAFGRVSLLVLLDSGEIACALFVFDSWQLYFLSYLE